MRPIIMGICGAALLASPSLAQTCPDGSSLALTVTDWQVSETETFGIRYAKVSVTLQNNLDLGFRLIDGSIHFADVLGGSYGAIAIDRASNADAGGEIHVEGTYSGNRLLELRELHRDDVVVTACTVAVVTHDGEVISNPGPPETAHFDESLIDEAKNAMMRCWNPPVAALSQGLQVSLRFALLPNGSLAGQPEITSTINNDLERSTALSAQRAIQQCAPYMMLPEASYEHWGTMEVTFDTGDL